MKALGLIAMLLVQGPLSPSGPSTARTEKVPPMVIGRFVVEGGLPLPPATGTLVPGLQFRAPDGGLVGEAARMKMDGSFSAVLPAGNYRVSLMNLPWGYSLKSISFGSVDLQKGSFKVEETSSNAIEIVLEILPGVRVSGRVAYLPADYSTRFPTGPTVTLGWEGRQMFETKLNADGSFEFPRVPPRDYRIFPSGGRSTSLVVGSQNLTGVAVEWLPSGLQ